jgi:L-lactate permease
LNGKQLGDFLLHVGLENLERVLPLLACCEPASIRELTVGTWKRMSAVRHCAIVALGAALGAGGDAAAGSHCATLVMHGYFQDDAACAALLPMLMATALVTVRLGYVLEAQVAAIFCPAALAVVTRSICLHMTCEPDARLLVRAAIDAAGKSHLVRVVMRCPG